MKRFFFIITIVAVFITQGFGYHTRALLKTLAGKDTVAAKVDTMKCCMMDTTKKAGAKKELSAYERLLKDGGTEHVGMFTARHIKGVWYFEIPDSLLGRLMLVVTRFTGVPQGFKMLSGEEVNRSAIYFEQYNSSTLFLREYVQSQYSDPEDNISSALKQSTIDPIIYKLDVIGRNPKTNSQLVNVSKLLLADNKLTGFTSKDKGILNVGGMVTDRSFIDTIKTYPINVEVQTLRTYSVSEGKVPATQTGSVTLSLNTSIVMLPKVPMQKRLQDERVGYFSDTYTEFSDDQQTTEHESIISRYRLEPKNMSRYRRGELTEPKKQIVYYIDPATPKKWRKYLKAGINDWNKAFEAAGFKNAIVAKDWVNDSTKSLDDARFCVLRYLPSENENAYGPRIVDPRSGEIIESHICWYHNVMNLLKKWYMVQCGPLDPRARKMTFDDELMGQLIRFVSSHEVGHTLGLRHNMCASSATPVEKLRDKKWVEAHGHTISIMDYARFNYVAQPEDGISEKGLFPRINDYDLWAIKWGYQCRPEFKDAVTEKKALRAEVSKTLKANPSLSFCGDEGKGMDPRSQSEDLGDDNMKASDYGIKNLKRVMTNILEWTAQPDGQYDDLNTIHKAVRAQFTRYTIHVQKNICGRYVNTVPGETPYDYVPRSKEKEAVDWIGRQVFDAPLWLYPDDVVNKLGLDAVDEISNRQSTVLALLLAPGMIYNIHTAELRASEPYPVDEYLNDVFSTVWKPLNDKNEQKNDYRRQLERTYIIYVNNILNPSEKDLSGINVSANRSDVILYAQQHLDKIEKYLNNQQSSVAEGTINRLHYDNLLLLVKKIKDKYTSNK